MKWKISRRQSWGWGAPAAALLAGLWLWLAGSTDGSPSYLTQPATVADIEEVVLATGTIRASRMVNVGAQVSGQVQALYVKLGEAVKKGQLIAEIDPSQQLGAIREESAQIKLLRAQEPARRAALGQAQMNAQRQQMMWQEDATSASDLQAAKVALEAAQSEYNALKAQLEQADNKLQTAQTNLSYTRIVAPMDGVVVAVVTEAGQTLNSAQSVPTVVKLAQLDPMLIEAQISEADVPHVQPGMAAWFTILGDDKTRFATHLASIDPGPTDIAKEAAGSSTNAVYYNGLLYVQNTQGKLRISMTAKVRIVLAQAKGVLTIPASALQAGREDGHHTVQVMQQEGNGQPTLHARVVKVGINNRVSAQILEGLREGEWVVTGKARTKDEAEADRAAADSQGF